MMFGSVIVLFFFTTLVTSFSVKEYGYYKTEVLYYNVELNKNVKEFLYFDYLFDKHKNGTMSVTVHSKATKVLGVIGLKIRLFIFKEDLKKFTPVITKAMKNVCNNQLAKEILYLLPGLNKDCSVKPGYFNFTISDFDGFVHILTNGKFFYGKYMVYSDIFAGKQRILRCNCSALIKPI